MTAFGASIGREAYRTCTSVTLSLVNIDEIRELIALANESGVAGTGDANAAKTASASAARGFSSRRRSSSSRRRRLPSAAPAIESRSNAGCGTSQTREARRSRPEPDAGQIAHRRHLLRIRFAGRSPFVRVGERVQPGKVLCIIESMKLMNEIEAEVPGSWKASS